MVTKLLNKTSSLHSRPGEALIQGKCPGNPAQELQSTQAQLAMPIVKFTKNTHSLVLSYTVKDQAL